MSQQHVSFRLKNCITDPAPASAYGWLEVKCKRCETSASILLDAIRRPRDTPIWKLEAALKLPVMRYAPVQAASAYGQAH
jgi:phage FluMu protein Com